MFYICCVNETLGVTFVKLMPNKNALFLMTPFRVLVEKNLEFMHMKLVKTLL